MIAEIREITQLDRNQAYHLMRSLEREGVAVGEGRGRGSRWMHARR